MKIVVSHTSNNEYKAEVEGHPEIVGVGNSKAAAVGSLMIQHQRVLGVEIKTD